MPSIRTNVGRKKLAKIFNAELTSKPVVYMAFGNGGTDASGIARNLVGEESKLFNEVIRKMPTITIVGDYTIRHKADINAKVDKLVGQKINEVALFDADDEMIAIKTFTNKVLDEDTIIEMNYDLEF